MIHLFLTKNSYYNTFIAAGEDFEEIVNKSLVFAPGFDLTRCVHIPILPDDCLEQMESFNISLSADHIGINLTTDEVTVYIIEDDCK